LPVTLRPLARLTYMGELDVRLLVRAPPPANPKATVQRRERIGGLLNH